MSFIKAITTVGVIVFFSVFFHHRVYAETYVQEFSSYYDVKENNVASVKFINEVTNSSTTSLIDKFTVIIPFSDANDIIVTRNGERVNAVKRDYNDHIEISIDLKNNPVGNGRKYIFESVFTTSQIADTFYGLKRLYIPGVDKNTKIKEIKIKVPQEWKIEDGSHEYIYKTNSNIYLVVGDSSAVNFSLFQKLENKSQKPKKLRFLLPYENFFQGVLYYPSTSLFDIYIDNASNVYIELNLDPGEQKDIFVEGLVQLGSTSNFFEKGDVLSETEIWDYNSDSIKEKKKQFENSSVNIEDIYKFFLSKYHPVNGKLTEREKISDLVSRTELNEIQYCDLSVGLLRSLGIKSVVSIGHNFAYSKIGKELEYTCWVDYRLNNNSGWKVFDPYFMQTQDLEFESNSMIDRVGHFTINGEEDKDILNYFFSDETNYIAYKAPDTTLGDKGIFNYDFSLTSPDKVPLNIGFSVDVLIKNNSNKLINFESATSNSNTLNIVSRNRSSWIFPGQGKHFELKNLRIDGFGIKKETVFDLNLKIVDSLGAEKNENITKSITGIPKLESFTTLLGIVFVVFIVSIVVFYNKNGIKKVFRHKIRWFKKKAN